MRRDIHERADELRETISNLHKLRYLVAGSGYKRFRRIRERLMISDVPENTIAICDGELRQLIKDYCDKKIAELQSEYNNL